jgi:hypothetical protein
MTFGYVPSPAAGQWQKALGYLKPALARGGYTWEECAKLIDSGHAQLWMSDEAALVSRRDGDTLELWLCGGRVVNASDKYLAVIERAAKESGMKWMRVTGRKGWERHLKRFGWVRVGEDLMKDIANG